MEHGTKGHRLITKMRVSAFVLLSFALLLSTAAHAEWPMARQNPARTGALVGSGNLVDTPAPYWRHFNGGSLLASAAVVAEVNGDGVADVIVIAGGQVIARDVNSGIDLWIQNGVSVLNINQVADLDGDNALELVVSGSQRTWVLSVADGSVLWAQPEDFGVSRTVRVQDMNSDGLDDILMQECQCCSGSSATTGYVYSFGNGFGSPIRLWTLPQIFCGSYVTTTVARLGGAAPVHVVLSQPDRLRVVNATNGANIAESNPLVGPVPATRCRSVDVTGGGSDELMCWLNPERRVFVFTLNGISLSALWAAQIGELANGIAMPPGGVNDLDDDGSIEMVIGARAANNDPLVEVRDAANGAVLATLSNRFVQGVSPPLADGTRVLFAALDDELFAYRFDRAAATTLQLIWSLPDRKVMGQVDRDIWTAAEEGAAIVSFDADGDAIEELPVLNADGTELRLLAALGGTPIEVGNTYVLPAEQTVLHGFVVQGVSGAFEELALARSDGRLQVVDPQLDPISGGLRFGGYFSQELFRGLQQVPVIASLDGGSAQSVIMHDSRTRVNVLDARDATLVTGPAVTWSRKSTKAPVVVDGIDAGGRGVVAIDTEGDDDAIVALSGADGSEMWRRDIAGIATADLIPIDLTNDAVEDIVVEYGPTSDPIVETRAIDGSDGSVLWDAAPYGPFTRQPAGNAAADFNGDGTPDIIVQRDTIQVLGGASGNVIFNGAAGFAYGMPMMFDVDDDPALEAAVYATTVPGKLLDDDLQTQLWAAENDVPLTYAAATDCADGVPRIVTTARIDPGVLKITPMMGPGAGVPVHVVVASGAAYNDIDEAMMAGAQLGEMSSPSIHTNLSGDNVPIAAIGSGDGYVYAVEACSGVLRFAVNVGAQVGSVLFGDGNGDGNDEIIASASDGYIYGIQELLIQPPASVIDTDPPNGITDEDVDAIATEDTLHGAWSAVDDAAFYEVAIALPEEGGFVTDPPWINVGNVTSASVSDLQLTDGQRYLFAVRAFNADGERSPDVFSDGVVVDIATPGPTTGAGGFTPIDDDDGLGPKIHLVGRSCIFCALPAAPIDDHGWAWLALLGLLSLRRRRQTRRTRRRA